MKAYNLFALLALLFVMAPQAKEKMSLSARNSNLVDSNNVRLAMVGDYEIAGQPEADVANLVKSWNPDYVLTTGDNN